MEASLPYKYVYLNLAAGDEIPSAAVIAGYEKGKPTYVARARHGDTWELGKLSSWRKIGYSLDGREHEVAEGEVLVATAGQEAAWISGSFGEEVDDVMPSAHGQYTQFVARVWYNNRWIPGKMVPHCHNMYFAFGGKEIAMRNYQLLSTDFMWLEMGESGAFPTCAVPLDSSMPMDAGNCMYLSYTDNNSIRSAPQKVLSRLSQRECSWLVSGDAEYVRHAVVSYGGDLLARVFIDTGSEERWACGTVQYSKNGAVLASGGYRHDYQVLTAAPLPATLGEDGASQRLLSLSIGVEGLEGLANELTPPGDIFLVTKLQPGEKPLDALKEMLASSPTNEIRRELTKQLEPPRPASIIPDHIDRSSAYARSGPGGTFGASLTAGESSQPAPAPDTPPVASDSASASGAASSDAAGPRPQPTAPFADPADFHDQSDSASAYAYSYAGPGGTFGGTSAAGEQPRSTPTPMPSAQPASEALHANATDTAFTSSGPGWGFHSSWGHPRRSEDGSSTSAFAAHGVPQFSLADYPGCWGPHDGPGGPWVGDGGLSQAVADWMKGQDSRHSDARGQ